MTYKMNPGIAKMKSPVIVLLPTGEEMRFATGEEAAAADFDKHYVIAEITAKGDKLLVEVEEVGMPQMNWAGEEATFF
ncbi:MAG: hypothetical protein IJ521_04395 [Schwartzia sp.]|nr:hypothetical protein [Schwartzia sp. (in: firmicutes)]